MNTIRLCRQCGQPLPENAPEGLCPACLAKVALGSEPPAKPAIKAKSGEPASTITIGPEAFVRVRYFGDYELLEEIARGGMGVVWKARQSSLNRTIALKMILAGKLANEAEIQRFRREAEAAANLQHPNIVAIHEVGEHDGQHYYSMDYVAGRDLGAQVRESGPLPATRASECVKTLAEAVHFAHQRGTLHRDLKPQNVLMDSAGVPHITDFGLAKFVERDESLTQTGTAMGSPSYMPPEQAAGHLDQVGPHSDVYALGAILYELLTGRPPFRAETAVATMRQVMESEPAAPRKLNAAVPPDLETICLKCLEKNPARRYPSARALAEDLGRFLQHEPIHAVRAGAFRKAESWLRRHPWTLMTAASTVAMVLAGLLDWQHEKVKFLEGPRLLTDPAVRDHVLWKELEPWNEASFVLSVITVFAFAFFTLSAAGNPDWKAFFKRQTHRAFIRPVSQRMRVVCGLISVAGLGFAVFYATKIIHYSVWISWNEQNLSRLAWVWPIFYISLFLLFRVARDYQHYLHGTPSRTLSPGQSEAFRKAMLAGDIPSAAKIYGQALPDVQSDEALDRITKLDSEMKARIFVGLDIGAIEIYRKALPETPLDEALDFVNKFATELRTKHPEKFGPPRKLWELNWLGMGKYLFVAAGLFAFIWLFAPPMAPATRFLIFAEWFLAGAVFILLIFLPLKKSWMRLLGLMCIVLPVLVTHRFYQDGIFLVGFLSGISVMASGFTSKRRKSVPTRDALTDKARSNETKAIP